MNKELEALKNLGTHRIEYREGFEFGFTKTMPFKSTKEFKIIEEALQRLESIDNAIAICKKANEQKYVYIKETYGISKEKFLDDLDYEVLNNRLYVSSRGMYYDFPLKDYGNWWALTKEELENE